jgi:HK97 gp10 family phage protein
MTTTVSVKVTGVGQAVTNLKTLEYNARRRVVSAAVRAANAVVVRTAKTHAPRKTGTLASSIRGSLKLERSTGSVVGTVTFKSTKAQKEKGRDAWYAHIVIGGSKPHVIPRQGRNKKGARRYAVIAGQPYSRAKHPGTKPNPFMERAAEAAFTPAVSAFERRFSEAMETEIRKLSK